MPISITSEGITNLSNGTSLSLKSSDIRDMGFIGQGSSAAVFAAVHLPSSTQVAIKSINIYMQDRRHQLVNELKALDNFDSPFLVKFFGAFFDEHRVKLVMELMDLHSVRKLSRAPEPVLRSIVWHTLQGLAYLHNTVKVCHRDIKPDNILVNSKGQVKLSDFGISKALEEGAMCSSYVGTIKYMSPERIHRDIYGPPADVWGLGLVMYELATGHFPYPDSDNVVAQFENLKEPPPSLPSGFSVELTEFVTMCLQIQPELRPDVQQLLSHRWILQGPSANVADWVVNHSILF